MKKYASVLILSSIQMISALSWACWNGYSEDIARKKVVVYSQPRDRSSSYPVGNIQASQKVCVSNSSNGGYAEVRYEDPTRPGVKKMGYISVGELRGVRTEAVAPYCADCVQDEGASLYTAVENGTEDIRTVAQRASVTSIRGLGAPLPYADRIMENIQYGLALGRTRDPGDRKCARAVARILRAADLLPGAPGPIKTQGGFNGEDGYGFLSSHSFKDDKSACNRPGVVRIYGQAKPGFGKRPGQRGYLAGDTFGHAEILGTDGKFYFYTADTAPINEILGEGRRPLLHCMVSTVGMNGGRL